MKYCFECYSSINRKKLFFGLTVIYSLIFAGVLYVYGWSILPVFRFRNTVTPDTHNAQTMDFVLDYDEHNDTSKVLVHRQLDIHLEDPILGHTGIGSSSGHSDDEYDGKKIPIAIGGGITSARLTDVKPTNIRSKFQFFTVLLPSFCRTAAKGDYHYNFYLAYDSNDAVFSQHSLLIAFQDAFDAMKNSACSSISMSLHFVECGHTGHPAWAQNDAMMEAYLDGSEYFYRVNDDSVMQTGGWTQVFIDTLNAYDPQNVGVVGPKHAGGNQLILTYDFVHRTHVDLFGFYYPRVFTDWYADDWITKVYLPKRSTKIRTILLEHTMQLGQRYKNDYSLFPKLEAQLEMDKKTIKRFVEYRQKDALKVDGSRIVSMSLYGKNPRFTWGAIRNAQLLPVVFPGWLLRVYVPKQGKDDNELSVPQRIVACLRRLGAQIVYVSASKLGGGMPPRWWRYLIADDLSVKYFLIRDADSRLSDRDAVAVNEWIESSHAVHCIRDQPSHAIQPVVDGLWGGRPELIHAALGSTMHSLLADFFGPSTNTSSVTGNSSVKFLTESFWRRVVSSSMCHDSVSCRNWTRTRSFPQQQPSSLEEYLGQTFTEYQTLADRKNMTSLVECSGRDKVVFTDSQVSLIPTVSSSTMPVDITANKSLTV